MRLILLVVGAGLCYAADAPIPIYVQIPMALYTMWYDFVEGL